MKVTDEESKIPINNAADLQLKRLMGLLNVDPSDGDVIVDSILDWIDADDLATTRRVLVTLTERAEARVAASLS